MKNEDFNKAFPDDFEVFVILNSIKIDGKYYLPVSEIRKWLKQKIKGAENETITKN